jgi:hypothetical protein
MQQQQLDFWPPKRKAKAPYEQGPWESLSSEAQAEMTERLARLIAATIRPQPSDPRHEDNHEQ